MKKLLYGTLILLCTVSFFINKSSFEEAVKNDSYAFFMNQQEEAWFVNVEGMENEDLFYQNVLQQVNENDVLIIKTPKIALPVQDIPVTIQYEIMTSPETWKQKHICDVKELNEGSCQRKMKLTESEVTIQYLKSQALNSFYMIGDPLRLQAVYTSWNDTFPNAVYTVSNETDLLQTYTMIQNILIAVSSQKEIVYTSLFLLIIITGFYAFSRLKKIAIYRLHGYHWFRIWWIENRCFIIFYAFCALLCLIALLFTYRHSLTYDTICWILMYDIIICLLLGGISMFVSLFFWIQCMHQNFLSQLHLELHAKASNRLLIVIKLIAIPLLLLATCPMLHFSKSGIRLLKNNAYYHTLSNGYTSYDFQSDVNQKNALDGYIKTVRDAFQNTFIVYSMQTPMSYSDDMLNSQVFQTYGNEVNTDFVNDQSLLDEKGNSIELKKDEEYIIISHGLKNKVSFEDLRYYQLESDHIVYLKEDQPLFLFDIVEKKGMNGVHLNYILYVNAVSNQLLNTHTLIVKASAEDMKDCLRKHGIQDRLIYQSVTSVSDRASDKTISRAWEQIQIFLFHFVLVMFLLFGNLYFYFHQHIKRIFIKTMMGYSFLRIFFGVCLQELVLLAICFVSTDLLLKAGINGFYAQEAVSAFVIIVLMEVIFFFGFLLYFKYKSLAKGLKGDIL